MMSGRAVWMGSVVMGLMVGGPGCQSAEDDVGTETLAVQDSGETVSRWNQNGFTALTVGPDVRFQVRGLTMMHIAMHDAANAVRPKYASYALGAVDGEGADPALAAAAAAHDVVVALRPTMESQADQWLEVDLAEVSNESRRQRSLEVGAMAAEAILDLRANDNCCNDFQYVPGNQPGDYQFTPPFNQFSFAYGTGWGLMTPFSLDSGAQFPAPPPPALSSAEWAADYNEVKDLGRQGSTFRTPAQTFAAFFWVDGTAEIYSRATRNLIAEQDADLWDAARAFALAFIAGGDGAIVSFYSKYQTYEFWRPITAIRAGDTDGNAATVQDSSWTPAATTPPTPEYTSTHALTCHAIIGALIEVFGDVPIHATSSIVPGDVSWPSMTASAAECAEARIWVGYHYRSSVEEGAVQGTAVGQWVVDNTGLDRL
jgi:hypothetical protein